ncbi:MAG: glutamate racemase [Firmicutes bacterium]|nr:glutamate racemase [Bacillota bacterium]
MNRKQDYIAVFDSGVGGISVLRRLVELLPRERFLYYGDSANAPYGVRPPEQVRRLALEAAALLCRQGIKALVVACNTATAAAVETLRQTYPDTIVVGIEPAVKLAADRFPGRAVGVMATPLTMESHRFRALLEHHGDRCRFLPLPAPGLADLVEEGKASSPECEALLTPLLAPLRGKLDAVVLGCTHYPFAADTIRALLGSDTVLLDGGEGTARETKRRLEAAGLLYEGPGEVTIQNSSPDPRMLLLSRELLAYSGGMGNSESEIRNTIAGRG